MSYKIPHMRSRRKPTDAELAILRVLWTRGPSTVREVAVANPAADAGSVRWEVVEVLERGRP